jgi:hypothetical protein
MPLLLLGFFVLQLDRSNISNALTSTIVKDIKVTNSDTINTGNQLQLAAIIIFEIPFMLLLQKAGPARWLTCQIFLWGLIALFQYAMNNQVSYFSTRFLLGMFEAGYIPGSQFFLATFYKKEELARRIAIFYIGNYGAGGIGSLMAAGIFNIAGVRGLAGWQWLFIIDGTFTCCVGFIFIILLPQSTLRTLPLCGRFDAFTDRDRHIMHNRVILDDPAKEIPFNKFTLKQVTASLMNYRLWCHFAINVLALTPKGGLALYSPTIIKALGFDTTKANALSSVSSFAVIILSLGAAWISDATRQRGIWNILAVGWSMIFCGVLMGVPYNADKWVRYAIFTLLNSGNAVSQGLNDAWLSVNARNPQDRSIGLALVVIGSNLGSLSGQQLFRIDDAPKYDRAFLTILCIYAGSVVLTVLQMWIYWRDNEIAAKNERAGEEVDGQAVTERYRN